MKKVRLLLMVLVSALVSTVAQAELMVEFGYSTNYVTANQNGQGLTASAPRYVPFSMTEARSPVESTNYLGPVYYGGATGTVSLTSWTVANGGTGLDYVNVGGTSTGIGTRVVALMMFTNQSCTITQMTWSTRFGGTSGNQTNKVSFVVRKTSGSFYISEQFSDKSSVVKTNANLSTLAWYNYDPNTDIDTIGSVASGLTLSDVDAVGEWQDARTTALVQMGIGISAFRAWGTTGAVLSIEASPGSLNITEGTTSNLNVRLSSLPSASVTVSVNRVSGSTNLVVVPDPTALVFSTANWNVYQPVNVAALVDADASNDTATITCTDLGGTYPAKNVPVTQTDTTILPAVAGFNGAPASGFAPLTVTFTDTSTGNFITNRFWDFGDGETTNTLATSVSHTYTVAGSTNTVQLTLGNSLGESTTNRLDYIRVLPGIPPALPIYDAFNDSVSNSAIPTGWFCLAPGNPPANAAHSRIDAGSLSYAGLQASAGNSFGLGNKTDDYSLLFTLPNLGTNETVYFSTLLQLNSATPTNMTGLIRLFDGNDPFGSGVCVGVGVTNNESVMGFSINNRNSGWSEVTTRTPASYTATGVTHLIVGSYTRGTTATNGLTQLWINPDSATFGTTNPPVATLSTNSYGSEPNWNRLDVLSAGSGSWRTSWQMDEVRIATSWAAVVPAYVAAAPVITSALNVTGTVGQAFSYQIQANNIPASFDAVGLPTGLSINTNSGAITGTPVAAGSNDVTISASNMIGTDSQTLVLIIKMASPVITSVLSATGTVDQAFSYQITANNNPDSFDAAGLPAGLGINTNNGAITGTPSAAGSNDVTISASNAGGTASRTLVVVISPTEVVTDNDGDGLPNDWETLYFGGATDANPAAICANGINTVLQAYIAGLNPNDPQSLFRAAVLPPNVLSWNAASGRVYSVYWTTNLMNSFQLVATNVSWTQNSLTNPAPASSSFYKIDVRLE